MSSPALEFENVSAGYDHLTVLRDVSFSIASGSVTALIGANGAGKTTTLRALCGVAPVSKGQVRLFGQDITGTPPELVARAGVAHVPDGRGTFPSLTVMENLHTGSLIRSDRAGVKRDIARMLDYFPRLAERRAQQAGTLSGGEQQMLAIARALMSAPKLWLLDEPSFGLAPVIVEDVFEILSQIRADQGLSMLLVEQNTHHALKLADRAVLLEAGRIVAVGTAEAIAGDDAIRRSYLGETSDPQEHVI